MLGDLGKLIASKGYKKLPKVQKIARSGHTGRKVGRKVKLLQWGVEYDQVRFTEHQLTF